MRPQTLAVLCLALAGCPRTPATSAFEAPDAGPPEAQATTTRTEEHMSTGVSVTVAAPESPAVLEAIAAAFAEVARLETVLSEWRPGSEVSQVNARAGTTPLAVGPDVLANLQAGLEVGAASDGAFDMTVGALWGAWDFKWQAPKIPTPEELAPRLALIDYRKVHVDAAAHTVLLEKTGMKLALGGIAKGYTVDRVSALLKARGYPNHLVVVGGEVFGAGTKYGQKWRVGVRNPQTPDPYGTLEIQDEALSTSGNYERYFIRGGVRYHHLLSPRTGMPVHGLASVTVLAKTSTLADAWATALFVSGKERGLELAKRQGLEVLFFDETDFETTASAGFAKRLTVLPVEAPADAGPTR